MIVLHAGGHCTHVVGQVLTYPSRVGFAQVTFISLLPQASLSLYKRGKPAPFEIHVPVYLRGGEKRKRWETSRDSVRTAALDIYLSLEGISSIPFPCGLRTFFSFALILPSPAPPSFGQNPVTRIQQSPLSVHPCLFLSAIPQKKHLQV